MANFISIISGGEMGALAGCGISNHLILINQSYPLTHARNSMCKMALKNGADWLIFIEPEFIYPRGMIRDLLMSEESIIAPLAFMGSSMHQPLAGFRGGKDRDIFTPLVKYPAGKVEVDFTGFPGLLIRREVFEEIDSPWFELGYSKEAKENIVSEAIVFCEKAKEAGFSTFVDARIKTGAMATEVHGEGSWLARRNNVKEYLDAVKEESDEKNLDNDKDKD